MFKELRRVTRNQEGFTAIELLTAIAILGAIAYLILPLIFPSDSKTPEQYIEEDLNTVSEILKIRSLSAEANGIPMSEVYIGNLGVFASKSAVNHSITLDPINGTLSYCLRGEYKDKVLFYESNAGIVELPTGNLDCPGVPSNSQGESTDNNSSNAPTDGSPTTEEPSTEAPNVEEPAVSEDTTTEGTGTP